MLPLGVLVSGLVFGALAGLNSLGFVLLWRTNRLVNLAQPSLGLVGGTLTGLLIVAGKWSFWMAAPLGIVIGALLGFGVERLVLRRLRDAPRAVLLVATIGVAGILGGISSALPFIFGGPLPTYNVDLGFELDLFPVRLLGPHLLTLMVFPVAVIGIYLFLHRSRVGLAALALGQDVERARALGVPADVVRSAVWAVAGVLSTLAGILSIPVLGFNLGGGLGSLVLLLALAPAVFAAMRSVVGAAVAALALGVGYRAIFWYSPSAGVADLVLAVTLVAAVAIQRRRFGRTEVSVRASSWEAAATPRPLPWRIASSLRVRALGAVFVVLMLGAGIVPAATLPPGARVLYAGAAAVAVAVLATAVAWMFTGEIVLGHWGLAGLGAALAAVTPGPWVFKCLAAALVLTAGGALLAVATRRRSSLSFSVVGLAAAGAAPVAILSLGRDTVQTNPRIAGGAAAVVAILAAVAVARLRSSLVGVRMVAARDDPDRAPWLGADPTRLRILGLALSSGLAGLAGALYLAAIPAGIAPGAFDPLISLDLLAMAVVGGLGSPFGALAGAAVLQGARVLLPGPWAILASGLGVVIVVIFFPGGISRIITWVRDRIAAALVGRPGAPSATAPAPALEREAVSA